MDNRGSAEAEAPAPCGRSRRVVHGPFNTQAAARDTPVALVARAVDSSLLTLLASGLRSSAWGHLQPPIHRSTARSRNYVTSFLRFADKLQ
jgi:hypothetical protein